MSLLKTFGHGTLLYTIHIGLKCIISCSLNISYRFKMPKKTPKPRLCPWLMGNHQMSELFRSYGLCLSPKVNEVFREMSILLTWCESEIPLDITVCCDQRSLSQKNSKNCCAAIYTGPLGHPDITDMICSTCIGKCCHTSLNLNEGWDESCSRMNHCNSVGCTAVEKSLSLQVRISQNDTYLAN